jgi:hypothetical protein
MKRKIKTATVRLRYSQLLAITDALSLTKYDKYFNGRTALAICQKAVDALERKGAKSA